VTEKTTARCHGCAVHFWIEPQDVVWKDEEGRYFCIFHAPADKKYNALGSNDKISTWQFYNTVLLRITTAENINADECCLRGTIFHGNMTLPPARVDKALPTIDLSESVFSGKTLFHRYHFSSKVDLSFATFLDQAIFIDCTAEDGAIDLGGISTQSLGNIVFTRAGIPLFTFRSVTWPDRLALEDYPSARFVTCEELYRAMKQRAAGEHDQLMVSRWHYREKLMGLKRHVSGEDEAKAVTYPLALLAAVEDDRRSLCYRVIQWLRLAMAVPMRVWGTLTWWYWWCSGFGERPKRAFAVLLALILPLLIVFLFADLRPTDDTSAWGRILGALQHLLFVNTPSAAPKAPFWASFVVLLTRVAIPVQFGLFALAMRNRFRR